MINQNQDVQEYKSKLFEHIKDPKATHFSLRPTEVGQTEFGPRMSYKNILVS